MELLPTPRSPLSDWPKPATGVSPEGIWEDYTEVKGMVLVNHPTNSLWWMPGDRMNEGRKA